MSTRAQRIASARLPPSPPPPPPLTRRPLRSQVGIELTDFDKPSKAGDDEEEVAEVVGAPRSLMISKEIMEQVGMILSSLQLDPTVLTTLLAGGEQEQMKIMAALEVFKEEKDIDDLRDTLTRIAKRTLTTQDKVGGGGDHRARGDAHTHAMIDRHKCDQPAPGQPPCGQTPPLSIQHVWTRRNHLSPHLTPSATSALTPDPVRQPAGGIEQGHAHSGGAAGGGGVEGPRAGCDLG